MGSIAELLARRVGVIFLEAYLLTSLAYWTLVLQYLNLGGFTWVPKLARKRRD